MLKCTECGHIFEEGEQDVWKEHRGVFQEQAAYEEMSGCPLCRGAYEEALRCETCGKTFLKEEMTGVICNGCFDEYKNNIAMCYAVGRKSKEKIELNLFLHDTFSIEEIESILFIAAVERQQKGESICNRFVEQDEEWFAEKVAEVKNGK